ncbi:MAG TPA: hypothetical protein VG797_05895, partial [Phycisphaerales bacterium]|nr:hypothetical protein [Phycisphaerales bacterium]
IEPQSEEIRREIRRAQSQKDSLEHAKQSLVSLKTFTQEQVKAAKDAAAQAAEQVSAEAAAIEKLLNEEVKTKYDDAASKYASALSKANAARNGGSRQAVAVTSGTIQHAIGALQRERSESLARAGAFFADVGSMKPAPANAAHFVELASALTTEAGAAKATAGESYTTASGSMQGAGIEPYTRLSEQLTKVGQTLSGATPPPEQQPAPGEQPAEGTGETPPPAEPVTPHEQPAEQPPASPGS